MCFPRGWRIISRKLFRWVFVWVDKINQKNVKFDYVKGSAYKIHFWYISKDGAINMINKIKIFLLYIKMNNTTYYQRNRAKEYYKNNKERLRDQARNKIKRR